MDKLQTPPIRTPLAEGDRPAAAAKTVKEWYLHWKQTSDLTNAHTDAIAGLNAAVEALTQDVADGDAGAVQGRAALTTVNQIPKVVSAGTLGNSAASDDGTQVWLDGRRLLADGVGGSTTALAYSLVVKATLATQLALSRTTAPADANAIAGVDVYSTDGTTAEAIAATITFRANGAWTTTNHGTDIVFRGISNGSTTLTEWARFRNARLGLMNTNPQFPLDVTGDVNTTTVYRVAGTQVVGARGAALTASGAAVAVAPAAYSQAYEQTLATAINNLITRVNELQARLQAHGLIT